MMTEERNLVGMRVVVYELRKNLVGMRVAVYE